MHLLFDNIERTDEGLATHSEPEFDYLNRSARIEAKRIRDCLEEWFLHYPKEERLAFISAFRSQKDHQFTAAVFELYLYELLRRLGYAIEVHPETPTAKKGRPDFLVKSADAPDTYVEATLCTDMSDAERASEARKAAVYDALNKLGATDFFLDMAMRGEPETPVPGKSLRSSLSSWLKTLDVDAVAKATESEGYSALPTFPFEHEGWKVKFRAVPKSPKNRGKPGVRALGSQSFGAKMMSTWESLRAAIINKGSRYGELPGPLVVAVSVGSFHLHKIDVMQALFGQEPFLFPHKSPDGKPEMRRASNGVWWSKGGARYKRVSAVLIYPDLKAWTMGVRTARLYHNPWATHPCKGPICCLPQGVSKDDLMTDVDGIHPRTILGLPERWPE